MKYTAKKISKGHYLYRGYRINCVGYYAPDKHKCWEAVDKDGTGFAHSYSLRMTKALVDVRLPERNVVRRTDGDAVFLS